MGNIFLQTDLRILYKVAVFSRFELLLSKHWTLNNNVLFIMWKCWNVSSPPPCIKCVFSAAGLSLSTFYGLSFTQENFLLTWLDWYLLVLDHSGITGYTRSFTQENFLLTWLDWYLLVLDHSGKYWVQRVWSTKSLVIYLCVKHHMPYLVVFILEVFPNCIKFVNFNNQWLF